MRWSIYSKLYRGEWGANKFIVETKLTKCCCWLDLSNEYIITHYTILFIQEYAFIETQLQNVKKKGLEVLEVFVNRVNK